MTTTTNDAIPTPGIRTLAALRAVTAEPSQPISSMFCAADCQAWMLRNLLLGMPGQLAVSITTLIPTICISYINDLPASGISFWARGQWHIHVRAGDRIEIQMFTIMHEVKHIIDHPMRRKSNHRSGANWESLANHFAAKVLVIDAIYLRKIEERRVA